jgi:hypothetical protein
MTEMQGVPIAVHEMFIFEPTVALVIDVGDRKWILASVLVKRFDDLLF